MDKIREILKEKILVLDGAMGTMIQQYPLEEKDFRSERFKDHESDLKGNNDLLTLTRPDIIKEIHGQYFDAGSDIAETNTFSSTWIAQKDYHLDTEEVVYDLNYQGAQLAREVADEYTKKNPDKPRFVAGVLGPTNKTASISPDVNDPGFRDTSFDELADAYGFQTKALIEGGVDMLLVETIFDTLNAKAALFGVSRVLEEKGMEDFPIMVSGTITDASGRTLSGQTTEAFLISVSHMNLLSVGLNCALGAKDLHPYLQTLSERCPFHVSAHPNAGLPNEFGEYDQQPDEMAKEVEVFLKEGLLNIIGGCCGSKPEHIQAIAEAAAKHQPRKMPEGVNV